MCGLKNPCSRFHGLENIVAPLAGVWIEKVTGNKQQKSAEVAPLAGVWIEKLDYRFQEGSARVAPLAGVWIENCWQVLPYLPAPRRTPRGCVD